MAQVQRVRQGGQECVRAGRAQRDGAGGPESDFLRQGRRRGGELREGKERGGVVRLVQGGRRWRELPWGAGG